MDLARRCRTALAVLVTTTLTVLTGCMSPENPPAATPTTHSAAAQTVVTIIRDAMAEQHLRAVIVRVTIDGKDVVTQAFGDSMTGVPATTDMHFRNGAVAISYVATLLLRLVDQKKVRLDDTLATWLPEIPHAQRVTLRQLAQMTSGYPDYVLGNDTFAEALYRDPFRQWEPAELLDFATSQPLLYEPGTNWNYAHTDYVLLGMALERATGRQMPELLSEQVLDPLGLKDTANSFTPAIPAPALHAFSSERRAALQIPPDIPFYEESTFFNPSWTITHGAVQTTTIADMAAGAAGVGSGRLLSTESYEDMVSTNLRGRTHAQPGCPTCRALDDRYTYGLGLAISGDWLLQNPMFFGYAGMAAYLPARKIAIAIATTFEPGAFDDEGGYHNATETLFGRIATELAPEHAPPRPTG